MNYSEYLICGLLLVIFFGLYRLVSFFKRKHLNALYGRELKDPFLAEVYFKNRVVGILSERVFNEMFWYKYKLTPISDEAASIITDDNLWNESGFLIRDPKSGMVCDSYLAAGPPFVRDSYILIRGLYFKKDTSLINSNEGTCDTP